MNNLHQGNFFHLKDSIQYVPMIIRTNTITIITLPSSNKNSLAIKLEVLKKFNKMSMESKVYTGTGIRFQFLPHFKNSTGGYGKKCDAFLMIARTCGFLT